MNTWNNQSVKKKWVDTSLLRWYIFNYKNKNILLSRFPYNWCPDISVARQKRCTINANSIAYTYVFPLWYGYQQILKSLPDELQTDVCLHLHREFLHLPVFQSISHAGLRCLSSRIETCYCAPSEIIIYEGELYHPLYFVASGTLQVLRNDVVVAILGKFII